MTLVLKDRVKEQTTTTGTGTVTLGGAVSGFEAFSAVGDGNTTYYAIVHQTADEWEVGLGTYTAAGTLLSRDTILESTNSDAAVNFSAGTKDVFVTYPSDKAVYADAAGDVNVTGNLLASNAAGPALLNEAAAFNNPTIAPLKTDTATGWGSGGANNLDGVVGGTRTVNFGAGATAFYNSSGNEVARIDRSSGNVGIGTNIPGRLLEVLKSGVNDVNIAVIGGGSGAGGASVAIGASGTSSYIRGVNNGVGAYVPLNIGGSITTFEISASEKMRIDTSGNVGIGTTVPANKLDVVADGVRSAARASSTAGQSFLEAQASDYWSGPTYTGTSLRQYGSTATGTTAGLSNARLGSLSFQNGSVGLIMTNGGNPIAFATTSIERMRIDSSGRVGIGTTSPAAKLHSSVTSSGAALAGGVNVAGFFEASTVAGLQLSSGTGSPAYFFMGDAADVDAFRIQAGNGFTQIAASGASDYMRFDAGGFTERMRITSAGNVGIGTSSPTEKLDVNGNIKATGLTAGAVFSDKPADFWSVGASYFGVDTLGSLTTQGSFEVALTGNGYRGAGSLWVSQNNNSQTGATQITLNPAGYMSFRTEAVKSTGAGATVTERMRIDSSGNVGIGTTAPDGNLNVQRTAGSAGWIINGQTAGIANDSGFYMSAANHIEMAVRNGSGTFTAAVRSAGSTFFNGGNVGIGTASPSRPLHISASDCRIRLTDSDAPTISVELHNSNGSGILSTNGASSLLFQTNNAERMRINSVGSVGIGTTSPDFLLDVAGRIGILEGTNGIAFHDGAGSVSAGVRADSGNNLVFATGSSDTERMRITTGGNVGIGEIPGGSYKLQANGNIGGPNAKFAIYPSPGVSVKRTLSLSNNANATLHLDHDGGYNRFGCDNASQHFAFCAGGSTAGDINVVFKGDGNVGIGTTSPSTLLHLASTGSAILTLEADTDNVTESDNARIELLQDGGAVTGHMGYGSNTNGIDIWNDYNDYVRIGTNNSERMRIDSIGNVGIGTTSPAKQFEITKASRALIGTLTDGATITPDFDANQNFTVTLGGNRTLANPTNVDAGQTGSIFVVQDATGGRTLSFGSYWKFAGGTAPTLSTGTNAVDRIDYIVKSSTEIHAVASLNLS